MDFCQVPNLQVSPKTCKNSKTIEENWLLDSYLYYSKYQQKSIVGDHKCDIDYLDDGDIYNPEYRETFCYDAPFAVSPCCTYLATCVGHFIRIWDFKQKTLIFSINMINNSRSKCFLHFSTPHSSLNYSSDGKYLIYTIQEKVHHVIVWNLYERKEEFSINGSFFDQKTLFSLSKDQKKFALLTNKQLIIWNLLKNSEELILPDVLFEDVCFSSDSQYLITQERTVSLIIWSLKQKSIIINLEILLPSIKIISFQSNGTLILNNKKNGSIEVWNAFEEKKILNLENTKNFFSYEEDFIYYRNNSKDVIFNIKNLSRTFLILDKNRFSFCKKSFFSHEAKFLAMTFSESFMIFKNNQFLENEVLEPFVIFFMDVKNLLFSGDNSHCFVVSSSNKITVFELFKGEIVFQLDYNFNLRFTQKFYHHSVGKEIKDSEKIVKYYPEVKLTVGNVFTLNDFLKYKKNDSIKKPFKSFVSMNEEFHKGATISKSTLEYHDQDFNKEILIQKIKTSNQKYNFSFSESKMRNTIYSKHSPIKKFFTTNYRSNEILFWNFDENKQLFPFSNNPDILSCLSCSLDMKFAVVEFSNWTISVLNMNDKNIEFTPLIEDSVIEISLSSYGNYLSIIFKNNNVKVWKVKSNQEVFSFTVKNFNCFTFSPQEKYFLVCYEFGSIIIRNLELNQEEMAINEELEREAVFFFTNNDEFLLMNEKVTMGFFHFWNLKLKKKIKIMRNDLNDYRSRYYCIISDYSKICQLFAISRSGYRNCEVEIWNLMSENLVFSYETTEIRSLKFTPDGQNIALLLKGSILIINIQNHQEININRKIDFNDFKSFRKTLNFSFSHDSEVILLIKSKSVIILNIKENRYKKIKPMNNKSFMESVDSSMHENIILIKQDSSFIVFWNIYTLKSQLTIKNYNYLNVYKGRSPYCERNQLYKYCSNEEFLAIEDCNKSIKIYNLLEMKEEFTLNPCDYSSNLFSDDFEFNFCYYIDFIFSYYRKYFVTASRDGIINFWDLNERKFIFTLGNHVGVKKLFFSANENLLASACDQRTEIWDIQSRNVLYTINDTSENVAICPENVFCVFCQNLEIRIWDLKINRLLITLDYKLANLDCTNIIADTQVKLRIIISRQYLWISSLKGVFKFSLCNKLCLLLNKFLTICIKQRENFEDLHKDMIIALKLYDYDKFYSKSIIKAKKKYNQLASNFIIEYSLTKCSLLSKMLSRYIIEFAKLGCHLSHLSPHAIEILNHSYSIVADMEDGNDENNDMQVLLFLNDSSNEIIKN